MQSINISLNETLNLEQLKTFALVVESGSFSAAGNRLGLTQPAVSLQVRQLERRLSVRLLERVGKKASPTAAGADLLAHIPRIASAVDNAVYAVASHALGVTGRVRLGTGGTTCLYFLPPILRGLRKECPLLDIEVSTGNTDEYVRRIEENSLDLALVTLPVSARAVSVTPILKDEFLAIGRKGDAQWPARLTPETLRDLPLVQFDTGTSTRGIIDDWLRQGGRAVQPVMELDSVEAIKEMVAAGLGYSVLPKMAVTGRGLHPELELRPLSPGLYRTLALITRTDKPMNKGLYKVYQAIVHASAVVQQ